LKIGFLIPSIKSVPGKECGNIDKNDKIYVAGHEGMVGSAVLRLLKKQGCENLVVCPLAELDLRNSAAVEAFFASQKPDIVILAAARVGGIGANSAMQAEFIYDNLMIQCNVIHQAYLHGVKKLCFLGSSCIYPRRCPQPMKEDYLLTGPLEPTNEGYAIAKIAGLKMAQKYHEQYGFNVICLMPCNLYGTNDNFNLRHAHVLSSLVRKFVEAVENKAGKVEVWGTGKPLREFMHVDDAAAAIVFMMNNYESPELINIGWGKEISIKELAEMIAAETGFDGEIVWNTSKPDGMMRKCMDVSKMRGTGFEPTITLREGVRKTINEFKNLPRSGK